MHTKEKTNGQVHLLLFYLMPLMVMAETYTNHSSFYLIWSNGPTLPIAFLYWSVKKRIGHELIRGDNIPAVTTKAFALEIADVRVFV